jgi:hypothetical protein
METEHFEKIITVNDESFEIIRHYIDKLLFFMYKENSNKKIEYFILRLKDSEKSPFSKDLKLEWSCLKQPERLSPEDSNLHSEWGCSFPILFNTSEGIKKMEPGKRYDDNLNEIE